VQLASRNTDGRRIYVTFKELAEKAMGTSLSRADLHLSQTRDGELLLTSRQDGMIRMLVPDSGPTQTARLTP
jgi:hypothetical protein